MPGKVIAVKVAPGQAVAKGAGAAGRRGHEDGERDPRPRDGRVKSVAAKVGDAVAPGTVLVEMEE